MTFFADDLGTLGKEAGQAVLELSNDLVPLLSEQLYRSPIKAVEELVVNAFDAFAKNCLVFVPTAADLAPSNGKRFVVVFDDGDGMDKAGMIDLWRVGRSPKINLRLYKGRKQIGKFGIGKLATYTLSNRLTYISRTDSGIHLSTFDFASLKASADTSAQRIPVPLRQVPSVSSLFSNPGFKKACAAIGLDEQKLMKSSTWTMAILEDLKDRVVDMQYGRLRWVLETAMPLGADFALWVNGEPIESAKSKLAFVVNFDVADLPAAHLSKLNELWKANLKRKQQRIVSDFFPDGVTGSIGMVGTNASLYGGKSDDLARSYGFFVRVRNRLINLEDPLFGLSELSHKHLYRFRADIHADDMDADVKASREGVEYGARRAQLAALLRSVFNHARSLYDQYERDLEATGKTEDKRDYVPRRFVEYPLADTLANAGRAAAGSEADRSWFYVNVPAHEKTQQVIEHLLQDGARRGYRFEYIRAGRTERMVKLEVDTSTFFLNENHEFVRKHRDGDGEMCLKDLAIGEVMLEVYLRQEGVDSTKVGEVLERRDALLRSLAKDSIQNPTALAEYLREAAVDAAELEIALVTAMRAVGFTAKQISNADKPDGIALLADRPHGDKVITLEAKSSRRVDGLSHDDIGFATLREHLDETPNASGCLLVAPRFAGQTRSQVDNAIANQARANKISCWTVDALARVVENIERREINARSIFEIVTNQFAPADVEHAVNALLASPQWSEQEMTSAILEAIGELADRMQSRPLSVDMVATALTAKSQFRTAETEAVQRTLGQMAASSQGGMSLDKAGTSVTLHVAIEELRRRLRDRAGPKSVPARKPGLFQSQK